MLKRVDKLLIGKDIDRDPQVVTGANIVTLVASTGMADLEVVVLDKEKKVMAPGATIADSEFIYICQGTGDTFSYTNEVGTLVSGARKLIFSDKIEGAKVRSYQGRSFVVKAEQTSTVDFTGFTPVIGTEYLVHVVYKDIKEHPGQFTQTYRLIAATTNLDTYIALLVIKINSDSGRRVQASYVAGTDVLTLTGLEIPECATALTDIDKFSMVDFEAYFNYVDVDGNWQTIPSTVTTVTKTASVYGSGNWEQVRDLEKAQLAHVGITNKTQFPVIQPTMGTAVDSYYDLIVIEHDKSYLAPNVQGVEQAPITTVIALATAVTGINAGNQAADIIAHLNPWMASTPGAFANINI